MIEILYVGLLYSSATVENSGPFGEIVLQPVCGALLH